MTEGENVAKLHGSSSSFGSNPPRNNFATTNCAQFVAEMSLEQFAPYNTNFSEVQILLQRSSFQQQQQQWPI